MKPKRRKELAGLPYYGGKSPRGSLGPWIASMLPEGTTYVEPFCGMAGVLLCRRPVATEILNDADGHLVNWWRQVRDEPKELARLLLNTPYARVEYERCHDALMSGELDDDPLERARAYHVCIQQGFAHGLGVGKRGWGASYTDRGGRKARRMYKDDFMALAARLERVQLVNDDAVHTVEKCAKFGFAVLYLDPPYRSADTGPYAVKRYDAEALAVAMRDCKGFVAISGYDDDWDHLDWHRYSLDVKVSQGAWSGKRNRRTEVLWTNKPAVGVPKRTLMD